MIIYLIGCLATFILVIISIWIDYKCIEEVELRVKDIALMLFLISFSYAGLFILLVFIVDGLLQDKGNHVIFKIKK